MRPLLSVTFVLALAIATAQAQDNHPSPTPPSVPTLAPDTSHSDEPEITLEELIRLATANNPRLSMARENLEAARQRASASRAFPSPSLQLIPGFTGNREARDEDVILSQRLDLFGARRAKSQVFEAEARRAEAKNTLAQRGLVVEVKNAAAQLFAVQETENLERAQVAIAQQFRDAAARRAELGDVPPVQLQRAELELLRLQNNLSNASAQRLMQRAALNLLVGQPPTAPLRVALPLTAEPELAPNALRPDILGAQATLEARLAQARAVGRERLPTVELQARRSAFFGREGSYALRAVVTMPLFDFGALKGERRAAEAEARSQQATLQHLQQQAVSQVQTARVALEQSRQNATLYREKLLPLTLDLLRKTQIGYAQGASTYLEVLDAQRTARGVQSEYLQALVGVQNATTGLDAAINGGAPSLENSSENSILRGDAR